MRSYSEMLYFPYPSHHTPGRHDMADPAAFGPTYLRDAKEYARFCRMRGIFLVDGIEVWRRALEDRGLPEDVVSTKVLAATHLVRSLGEPPSVEKAV